MNAAATSTLHACDVCRLLRSDLRGKPDAQYCGVCKAWLCDDCRGSLTQRAVAAILQAGDLLGASKLLRGAGA